MFMNRGGSSINQSKPELPNFLSLSMLLFSAAFRGTMIKWYGNIALIGTNYVT